VIASYIAVGLLTTTPLLPWIQGALSLPDTIWAPAGIVLAVTGAMFAIAQYSLGDLLHGENSQFAKSVILAVSVVGMLASFLFTLLPAYILNGFSPITMTILVGDIVIGAWLVAPIVMIGLTED
jgi:uncharacterized protein YqhQ